MEQATCISRLSKDTSNSMFNPLGIVIPIFRKNNLFNFDNAITIRVNPKPLIPYLAQLQVKSLSLNALIIPQSDGSFVARAETNNFCANGQGETEEEVLKDIKDAVEILLEESEHPSGDVPWPNDCL